MASIWIRKSTGLPATSRVTRSSSPVMRTAWEPLGTSGPTVITAILGTELIPTHSRAGGTPSTSALLVWRIRTVLIPVIWAFIAKVVSFIWRFLFWCWWGDPEVALDLACLLTAAKNLARLWPHLQSYCSFLSWFSLCRLLKTFK